MHTHRTLWQQSRDKTFVYIVQYDQSFTPNVWGFQYKIKLAHVKQTPFWIHIIFYWWLFYGEQGQKEVRKCVWDIFALMHCGLCLQLSFWWFHLCMLTLAASHSPCSTLSVGYCLSLVLWDKQLSQVDWYENLTHKLCLHNDRGLMRENIPLPQSLLL